MNRHVRFDRITGLIFAALLISVGGADAGAARGTATVNHRAPSFVLDGLAGESVELSTFAGRPLYVNVFATWCPPCRAEMPLIARTLPEFAKRVTFLAVDAQEGPAIVRRYLGAVGVKARVAIDDGQFVASYGATSIPESIFIDRSGIVRAIVHGPIDEPVLRRDLAAISK